MRQIPVGFASPGVSHAPEIGLAAGLGDALLDTEGITSPPRLPHPQLPGGGGLGPFKGST